MKINDLKDKISNYGKDPVKLMSEDPEYQEAIAKLRELTKQRDILTAQLQKVEINIDMILAMIGANEEKKELDKKANAKFDYNR